MIVAVAIGYVIVMVVVAAAVAMRKANGNPEPVPSDWWPDFEREFHAYAQGSARQRRETWPGACPEGDLDHADDS